MSEEVVEETHEGGDEQVTEVQSEEVVVSDSAGNDEAPPPDTVRICLRPAFAEFIASGLFVFVSCGCGVNAAVSFTTPGPAVIAIALCFGVSLFVLAFMIGHISGGHINPVISVCFILLRKISPLRGAMYVLAQFFGMLLGVAFLRGCTPDSNMASSCFAANFVHPDMTSGAAFLSEVVLTFFLLLVVCAATDSNKSNQTLVPLAIGLCVTCCHLMSLPITGTSLNPTRSFASAAIASNVPGCGYVWGDMWVFWLGPFTGGILGSVLYEYVFRDGGRKVENLLMMYRRKGR